MAVRLQHKDLPAAHLPVRHPRMEAAAAAAIQAEHQDVQRRALLQRAAKAPLPGARAQAAPEDANHRAVQKANRADADTRQFQL